MGDFYPKIMNCCHEGFTRRVKYAYAGKTQYGYQGFLGGNTAFTTFRRVRKTICSCATPPWTSTYSIVYEMAAPEDYTVTTSGSFDPPDSAGWSCLCGPTALWWHQVALEDDYFLFEARDSGGVVWYSEEGFLEDEIADPGEDWGLDDLEAWDLDAQAWWTTFDLSTGTGVAAVWRDLLWGWGSYGGGTCPMANGGDGNGTFKSVEFHTHGGLPILLPADGQAAGTFYGLATWENVMIVRNWFRARAMIDSKAPSICASELEGAVPVVWADGICSLGGSVMSLPNTSLAGAGLLKVRARDSKANRTGPPMPACCNQPQ